MRNRYFLTVLFIGLGVIFSGCKETKKQKAEAEKRRQDSIQQVQRVKDSLQEVEQRIQDSLARIQEEEAERARAAAAAEEEAQSKKFHVIVGSFRVPSNADNFLAVQLSSHTQAKMFESPNGFKLVSIADFTTMDEAVAYINQHGGGGSEDGRSGMWVFEEGGQYNTAAYLESMGDAYGDDDDYYGGYDDYGSGSSGSSSESSSSSSGGDNDGYDFDF